ncbi:hypothetical protein AAG906_025438 [Vitis piasezkii]
MENDDDARTACFLWIIAWFDLVKDIDAGARGYGFVFIVTHRDRHCLNLSDRDIGALVIALGGIVYLGMPRMISTSSLFVLEGENDLIINVIWVLGGRSIAIDRNHSMFRTHLDRFLPICMVKHLLLRSLDSDNRANTTRQTESSSDSHLDNHCADNPDLALTTMRSESLNCTKWTYSKNSGTCKEFGEWKIALCKPDRL